MNKLKYTHYDIVFQEVPNEVSLVINISGCPHKCEGCHSKYLWDYVGNYLAEDIDNIIQKYKGLTTCICFMGGDQNLEELTELLFKVKYKHQLKTCVYSGVDDIQVFDNTLQYLDYLKIGKFNLKFGGLDKQTTNQRFYRIEKCKLEDITNVFWKQKQNLEGD